jgi:hypothetical protein
MRFDRPPGVGAAGGHGPIGYLVEEYQSGSRVLFRFTGPPGISGTHQWLGEPAPSGCRLSHTIDGRVAGKMLLWWPLVLRPLHDALIADALDKGELALTGALAGPRSWPRWVRLLRRRAAPRS